MSNLRADSKTTAAKVREQRDAREEARTAQDQAASKPAAKDPLDVELYNLPFTD